MTEQENLSNAMSVLDDQLDAKDNLYTQDELGNRIIIDDCIEVMKRIPDGAINLCVTDPPWGIDYQAFREKFKDVKIQNDKLEEYKVLMESFPYHLNRVLSKTGSVYVFCGATTPVTRDGKNLHWVPYDTMQRFWNAGFIPRRIMLWDKITPGRMYRYRARLEFVLWFTKKKPDWFGLGEFSDEVIQVAETEIEVVRYQKIAGVNKIHTAEKPVRIYEAFIMDTTREGALVMDPFAGSGPVIEACKNTNRKYLAIEKNGDYKGVLTERAIQETIFKYVVRTDTKQLGLADEPKADVKIEEVFGGPVTPQGESIANAMAALAESQGRENTASETGQLSSKTEEDREKNFLDKFQGEPLNDDRVPYEEEIPMVEDEEDECPEDPSEQGRE